MPSPQKPFSSQEGCPIKLLQCPLCFSHQTHPGSPWHKGRCPLSCQTPVGSLCGVNALRLPLCHGGFRDTQEPPEPHQSVLSWKRMSVEQCRQAPAGPAAALGPESHPWELLVALCDHGLSCPAATKLISCYQSPEKILPVSSVSGAFPKGF